MNPLKGEASLTIGDTTYTLVMDLNALCSAEEISGLDLDQLLDGLQRGRSLRVRRVLLWAGMQAKHPCHLIEAGEIMASGDGAAIHDAISKAVVGAFPPAKKGDGSDPQKAAK